LQVYHVVSVWLWEGDERRFMVAFHLLMLGILFQILFSLATLRYSWCCAGYLSVF
jgi:hypothetical protein